jgi:gliding motility-associated-like protein
VNGDFENGNTGFTSSLDYVTFFPFVCTLCPENSYAIGNNATAFHSGFTGTDHTNPPSGDFFIANAPGQAGAEIWCQSIQVTPQTTYTFTFWARDIANNNNPHPLAVLRPSFNGEVASDSLLAQGGWNSLSVTWFSDSLSTLDICIIDFQSQTGGNDFGLDDISLTACEPIVLSQTAFAGNDTTICSNDVISLGVMPISGYTYSWSNAVELSSNQVANPTFLAANTSGLAVEYQLAVTRDSADVGCIATDSITLVVLSMNSLDLGADHVVCPGDSVYIDCGVGWDSILWSNNISTSGFMAPAGTYSVSVYTGICSETDSLHVMEYEMPATGLPALVEHCNTEALLLQAEVPGVWTGETGTFENPISIELSGTYYFNYADSACEAVDTVDVALFDYWQANLSTDTTLCEGTQAILSAAYPGTWNTGTFGAILSVDTAGMYSIEIANGPCISNDTIRVISALLPRVQLGTDTTFCEDYPILLNAFNAEANYVWSTGDTVPSIPTAGSGIYSVEVSNLCGSVSDEILITNYPCSWQLFAPSCFTPNDDTFNEGWKVSGYNIEAIQLTIYNRLGNAIFHTTQWDEAWKPGEAVGDDVYNYRIEITPFEGSKEVRTGHMYLVR